MSTGKWKKCIKKTKVSERKKTESVEGKKLMKK